MKSFCAYGYIILMHRNFNLGHGSVFVQKVIAL